MIYITGDTHGYFNRVRHFSKGRGLTRDDVVIILGDAGLNFWGGKNDRKLKKKVDKIGCTILCIHGNHEERPSAIPTYREKEWREGVVYVEDAFPNILFAKDGSVFNLDGYNTLVCGGAYSIDKKWRLEEHRPWWDSEQPSQEIKDRVEQACEACNWTVDCVLTHTCPLSMQPREVFFKNFDQSTVDTSTEAWLQTLWDKLNFSVWYAGHYHTDKVDGKLKFLFKSIEQFPNGPVLCTQEQYADFVKNPKANM